MSDYQVFVDWLNLEMGKNKLTQTQLAVRAGVSQSLMSKVIRMERVPTDDFCTKIAYALKYPPEFVFRTAGLLPKEQPDAH